MSLAFFRGDSRPPEEIISAGGFQAWVPLSTDQARALARKALGHDIDNALFPAPLRQVLDEIPVRKLVDLGVLIKYTKNQTTTPQVSTAPDEDCGGQANGTDSKGRKYLVYEVVYDALNILDDDIVRPARPSDTANLPMVRPKLLFDGIDVNSSTVLALLLKDEIAFLTSIALENIIRKRRDGIWSPM